MALIDPLLQSLLRHGMDSLLLSPGLLPRMVRDGAHHEVTKKPLSSRVIERLLSEIAPGDGPPPDAEIEPWAFDYQPGDRVFHFEARRRDNGWNAVCHPASASTPAGDSQTAVSSAPPSAPTSDSAAMSSPQPRAEPVVVPAVDAVGRMEALLDEMITLRASDLHLSSGEPIRFRIDGDLVIAEGHPSPTAEDLEAMLLAIAPSTSQSEYAETQDTDFGYALGDRGRFRANLFSERRGICGVFRQIPTQVPTADDLGLPPSIRGLSDLSKGLVLVTGPTGSGKSTTLAALIDLINRERQDHIITIEDPIEFVHPSRGCLVRQRQVGLHTGSFSKALRAALREDPDIVMVGEMRDLDTTSIAIETAETGHLVFGTLHTTSAAATIDRLINQYPADEQGQIRMMLADSLRAVVSQALLKKVGGGRVAAFEVLLCTAAISNMIREGKTFQLTSAMQTGRGLGMMLLNDSLSELVEKRLVDPEDAYLKSPDREDLVNRLRNAGLAPAFVRRIDSEAD